MAVTAFFTRYKDLAFKEMRACTVPPGKEVPAGEYGFLEFYCDDTSCDCRRVMIQVLRQDTGDKTWATISYGWEAPAYYTKWLGSSAVDGEEFARPTLDPMNPQSPYAGYFLALFTEMIKDKTYVGRLKRHYEMFRNPANRQLK